MSTVRHYLLHTKEKRKINRTRNNDQGLFRTVQKERQELIGGWRKIKENTRKSQSSKRLWSTIAEGRTQERKGWNTKKEKAPSCTWNQNQNLREIYARLLLPFVLSKFLCQQIPRVSAPTHLSIWRLWTQFHPQPILDPSNQFLMDSRWKVAKTILLCLPKCLLIGPLLCM